MSKVIVVANLKGGTGKTMCSVQLAGVLAECKPTLLVDADPQGSALKWAELVDLPFPVAGLPSRTIHRQLASLATGRDRVVIDTPPGQIAIVAVPSRSPTSCWSLFNQPPETSLNSLKLPSSSMTPRPPALQPSLCAGS